MADGHFRLMSRDDTVAQISLHLTAELPRKPSDTFRCYQAHRQSPILGSFESAPEVQLGPWGCSLVMILSHNGGDNSPVSSYRIEAVSGYAKGLNHFLTKLQEVEKIKAELQASQGYQPQL